MNIVVLLYLSHVALNFDKLTFATKIKLDYYKETLRHVNNFINKASSLAEENHPEFILFLEPKDMLGAYYIGRPQVLIIIFTVPAPIFCG